jgi:sigma-E factor negative regulatory protein RseB
LQVARRDDPSPPTARRVAWLPDGFAVAARDVYRTPASDNSVNTLMYSDGLAAFSVFVEEMPKNGAARMVSRQGATVAVTRVAHGPAGTTPYLITVVGEVPVATAQKVAESVRYNVSAQ